jgi:ABC-type Mn2+/Zn2+ transport system ATPase subunit
VAPDLRHNVLRDADVRDVVVDDIELTDVSVQFGSTSALSDLTVTIPRGRSIALVGANGSGKTTLLNVLAGLTVATKGAITPQPLPAAAFVLQHQQQTTWLPLTAREVIRMGRYRERGLWGRFRAEDRNIIDEVARRMEVVDLLDASFDTLSGGQQQRVLIAQALSQQASLLLLDEPITGLDLPSQQRILELIAEETTRGTTVLVSTHHLDEARHCDLVFLLANGLVAAGRPDDVLDPESLRKAFGERVLGDHAGHGHDADLLVLDHHGHDLGHHRD